MGTFDTWLSDIMGRYAIVTGITGQDGSYLADLLIEKNYSVHGILRRSSGIRTERVDHLYNHPNFHLHYGDMTDSTSLGRIITLIEKKDDVERLEVYNLAAMSHVQVSFECPVYTAETDGVGVLNFLEVIRHSPLCGRTRFYQASTSELYGKVQEIPQTEKTPFYPMSPYGVAKLYAFWICKNYRESYNMHISNGILFNHESPRRGPTFVTRKITRAIKRLLEEPNFVLELGNLDAKRDWGHARDYVEGMWRILQHDEPDDLVLSTGEQYSVRDFIHMSFGMRGMEIKWQGSGDSEEGLCTKTGRVLVKVNPRYYRPCEVETLLGDSSKAKEKLGWVATTSFKDLVQEMVDSDCPKK